jgi:hypothetical protein
MDAEQIRQFEPKLEGFLERFADCFALLLDRNTSTDGLPPESSQ